MNTVPTGQNLIRDTEAAYLLGFSKATFWRRVADKTIPKPIKIGGTSRWPVAEIVSVIDDAKAKRASRDFNQDRD